MVPHNTLKSSVARTTAFRTGVARYKRSSLHYWGLLPSARSLSSTTRQPDVRIIEVAPRDGLQNLKQLVPLGVKVELIQRLAETGLKDIEATSFVSPKWVPQLADGHEVMQESLRFSKSQPGMGSLRFPVLAPNAKGLQRAHAAGVKEIVVFCSATEAFSKSNQNCTIDEAIAQARAVTKDALALGIMVRG